MNQAEPHAHLGELDPDGLCVHDGGAITAAQLLARFVGKTAWAHLDIAGTALGSPQTEINKSWSSGWGVRLLDRLVGDYYER